MYVISCLYMLKVLCRISQGFCLVSPPFLLCINDTRLITNFDTTSFANDTSLMMADKNLKNLEHKVQIELKQANSWLRQNKLSLNLLTLTILYNIKQTTT